MNKHKMKHEKNMKKIFGKKVNKLNQKFIILKNLLISNIYLISYTPYIYI
jgi:hypothetical protein